ncbi:DNA-binding transcriptional regulator, LacI/PurR family [Friedmanniella luteola]|uniref:DNA-binding transcriptional regulator, LacI/PurR family n=1 Tax=Friedmanniella luteola TaxID=546871 RepID=A0A1H1YIX6_9ACTN|nr:LacI family DNA-binding transcriptional regulator [Friedmanniella luteola]SDT21275.1 DNA-binding transcriptional regulator, LacI/PurR family [Friedmanniella luteola]
MSRVTINEIARRSGVSKGAVSYALNNRPGVSAATRARILAVADQLGWAPNRTARLLSGSRTDTFGLILARDPRTLASEPFYMEFVAGLESVLSTRSYALLLQVCVDLDSELETYRKWSSERRVDAVVVVDVRGDDPRLPLLTELELPAVFVGDPSVTDSFTTVWTDDTAAMDAAVAYLVSLGHVRVARVSGLDDLSHVQIRDGAFLAAAAAHGAAGQIHVADFSAEGGRKGTRALLEAPDAPTAIMFDNDLMAVSALSALAELGVAVPDGVSILAWDDSALCEITHPQLSAMSHDVMGLGANVGRRLFDLLEGTPPSAHLDSTPELVVRGSTAPPPSAG